MEETPTPVVNNEECIELKNIKYNLLSNIKNVILASIFLSIYK